DPEQPPLQPEKTERAAGTADRTTFSPTTRVAEHAEPQRSSRVPSVTVPEPFPLFATVSDTCFAKTALAVVATVTAIVHVGALPEHAPSQWSKTDPGSGFAVSTSGDEPTVRFVVHTEPQSTSPSALVTVPVPLPARSTVTSTTTAGE